MTVWFVTAAQPCHLRSIYVGPVLWGKCYTVMSHVEDTLWEHQWSTWLSQKHGHKTCVQIIADNWLEFSGVKFEACQSLSRTSFSQTFENCKLGITVETELHIFLLSGSSSQFSVFCYPVLCQPLNFVFVTTQICVRHMDISIITHCSINHSRCFLKFTKWHLGSVCSC